MYAKPPEDLQDLVRAGGTGAFSSNVERDVLRKLNKRNPAS